MLKRLSCIAFIMALLSPVAIFASDNKFISPENVRFIFAEIKMKQAEAEKVRKAKAIAIAEEGDTDKKLAEEKKKTASKKAKNKKVVTNKSRKAVMEEDAPIDLSGNRLPDECMAPEDYFDAERDLPKEAVVEAPAALIDNINTLLAENKKDETTEKNEIAEVSDYVSEVDFCKRKERASKRFNAEALGWNSKLSGYVKAVENKSLPNSGKKISFGREVKNIGKKKVPGLKLSYELSEHSNLEFNWLEYEQSGMLVAGKTFKGKTYAANSRLEIRNRMYDFAWNYKFNQNIDNKDCKNNYVFALLGIRSWGARFEMDGLVAGDPETSSYSKDFIAPYLGVGYVCKIGEGFNFKSSINYLSIDNIEKYDGKSYDCDLAFSYRLSKKDCAQDVLIDLGYRQFSYNLKGKGNDIELKNKGPYIGLKFAF